MQDDSEPGQPAVRSAGGAAGARLHREADPPEPQGTFNERVTLFSVRQVEVVMSWTHVKRSR